MSRCASVQATVTEREREREREREIETAYPSSQLLNQRTNLHQIWNATAGSYKLVIFNFLHAVITTFRRTDLRSDTSSEVPKSCIMLDRQKYAFVQPFFFL